jgi:hypothetical protein
VLLFSLQLIQDSVGVIVTFPSAAATSEIKYSGFKASGNCGVSIGASATDAKGASAGNVTSNNNPASQFVVVPPVDMKGATRAHLVLSISAPAGNGGPNPCDATAQIEVIGQP